MKENIKKYLEVGGMEFIDVEFIDEIAVIKAMQSLPKEGTCPNCGGTHIHFHHIKKEREYQESPLIVGCPTVLQVQRVEATCKDCTRKFTVPSSLIKNRRMTTAQRNWIEFLIENPHGLSNKEIAEEACVDEKTIRRIKKGA